MYMANIFILELWNRFESLYRDHQEFEIDSEWTTGRDIIRNTYEEILGKKTTKRKNECLMLHG